MIQRKAVKCKNLSNYFSDLRCQRGTLHIRILAGVEDIPGLQVFLDFIHSTHESVRGGKVCLSFNFCELAVLLPAGRSALKANRIEIKTRLSENNVGQKLKCAVTVSYLTHTCNESKQRILRGVWCLASAAPRLTL